MAVSTERDPVATRADLGRWLGGADRRRRRRGRRARPSPACPGFSNETLLFDATWDGEVHPLVIRVEPTGHTVFPSTAFDAQVRVMQALQRRGHACRCPRCCGSRRTPTCSAPASCAWPGSRATCPADNPGYHGEGWMPALDEAGPAARVGERPRHDGGDPPARPRRRSGSTGSRDVSPARAARARPRVPHVRLRRRPVPRRSTAPSRSSRRASRRPADRPALCWGDSRIGNMIFGADQRVAAVLDWEMVTAGDPVQDLAWYLLLDRHHTMAFDVPRLPGLPAARGVDRPLGGGERPLGRAPRVVRAARRGPLRVDHGARDEAARLAPASSPAPPRAPSTRPAPACSPQMLDERY